MNVRAVCVDVDGTLYSIRRMVRDHLSTVWPLRRFFRDLHRVRDAMRGVHYDDFRREQARRLARETGTDEAEAARRVEEVVEQRWMNVFWTTRPFRGAEETLRRLVLGGLRLAVLSDYPIGIKLHGMGLGDLPFAARVNAERTGALKPHRAPFEAVSEQLGVEPDRILHIGDREEYDVAGALAAGFRAALFYSGRRRPRSRADFAFSDWRRLIPLMRWRGMV
ncbi:MAG: HAD family hydrolase [Deltaproteobacteria bacterium]|nr:HAD family hydrolase [Deltaproteobacteria bacterium]